NVHDATIKKNSQPKDVGVIESLINFYQLRWRMSGIFDEDIHGRNSSESESIQQIINTMSAADGPCILNIRFPYTVTRPDGHSWTEYGYHTVVGYGFSQKSSTQYSFKVYDPSRKDTVYTVKLFDQNGTYAKECSSWSSAWQKSKPRLSDDRVKNGYTATNFQGIELGSAFSGSDLCAPGILTQPSVLSEMQSLSNARDVYKLKTAYHAFTITDGIHSAVIVGGMKVSGDLEVTAYGNMNFYDQDPEYMFELPVLGDNGYYKIIPEEDGDSTTTLIYDSNTDGFYSRVETKTPGTFIFYADGTISTEFDEPAEQKITVLDSVMNTVWNKVILETTSSGITAKPYADKVTVVSDNETTMTVTAGSSLNSMTFENVPVSQKETVIKGDADGVCTIEYDGETVGTDVFGYSVVFDSRLGSTVDSLRNVPKGAKLEKPANPTREGYFFEGWYKDEQYKEAWDFDTDTVQGNIILYAAWNVDPNYFVTVTFRLPGDRTESVVVPNGYELTEEDCPVTAVGDQYVWYTDSGCTKAWTAGSAVTRNTVLYTFGWNVQDDSSLTVTPESLIMNAGDTKQLKAEGVTETVRWMSGDVNVATVDKNGVVTAVAEGTTTIAAVTATGKAGYCTVEVCPEGIYVKGMQSEYTYTGA
ncbi:MAG: InlB B-repeat-containing protein, partial [Erysipelotrichaceae bacterium]|nr:InlB B-repeat-containing protein [Erysipelotrichaceae bacterium]